MSETKKHFLSVGGININLFSPEKETIEKTMVLNNAGDPERHYISLQKVTISALKIERFVVNVIAKHVPHISTGEKPFYTLESCGVFDNLTAAKNDYDIWHDLLEQDAIKADYKIAANIV